MDNTPKLLITPQTKVGELLDTYPELEAVLIEITPAFKKLRNPVLRRTVARVTSLAQAARVGNVPVADLIRTLRQRVGQPDFEADAAASVSAGTSPGTAPDWMDQDAIVGSLDARPLIDAGEQPLGRVMQELRQLEPGQIFELLTPFEPAPLIDKAAAQGYGVWTVVRSTDEYHTYFVAR
ncbi:DUF1858 domain-containing protein [candidate division GN15 bacterium]|nr:DUF1858 domain-containing protein [candidate division GN15 bacterium]